MSVNGISMRYALYNAVYQRYRPYTIECINVMISIHVGIYMVRKLNGSDPRFKDSLTKER
jgi:hypothetical protein